ncbi:MAG: ATP-binding protein, partial [Phascolarctobacterium sp.]
GFSYMVNKDGRIILRPTHPNSNKTMQNLFDTFDKGTDKEVVKNLRQALAANENGWTEVMINGQSTLVCYASMDKSLGWSIVTLIPNSVINAEANDIIQNTMLLLAAFVLGILALIGVYVWQYRHYRAIQDSLLAAEHANHAKRAFLSTISHDVRTPLNGIIGMLDIAYMNIDNRAKLLECMGKIKTASNHLTELINQVLDMSRIESGKLSLQHEQMDVAELLQESVTIVQPLANYKHHELTLTVDVEHKQVLGDSIQLKQIFINLITNAIKYTENSGKIAVSLQELAPTQDKKQLYQLVVEDNGLGMSEEFQKHIFEPFSRVQDSTTSGIQGTGLGMSIMKRIVDLMQGHIELESALGKGSKFTITLPLEIVVEKKAEAKAQVADLSIFKGKHVLLVDDVELNREIGDYILSSAGFEVTALDDGKHAYEYMQQAKPGEVDLVLMDLMMPLMDGYTAARLIRNLPDKAVANTPIVALTANAFEETKKDVLAAGMNGHLAKPINKDELYKNLAGYFT